MMIEMVEHKCVCVHACLIFDWFLATFGRLTVNWDTDGWNYSVKNMQRWRYSAPNLKKKLLKVKENVTKYICSNQLRETSFFVLLILAPPVDKNDINTSTCVFEVSKRNITFLNKAVCRTYSSLSLKNVAGV